MFDISFSYNWNNKLNNKAFTTIRIFNTKIHVVGNEVKINMKGSDLGNGIITAVKPFLLHQLNPFISYLDTGYNVEQCTSIIRTMYPNIDFSTKQLALILIVKNKE